MSFEEREAVFQQRVEGYSGTLDTQLLSSKADKDYSGKSVLNVDGKPESVALLAFQDIFGSGADQIPLGSEIISATLTLYVTNSGHGASVHRLLTPWSDSDTWNSLGNGIQADDAEAAAEADLVTGWIDVGTIDLDVTSSIRAWAAGEPNHGWAFLPLGTNGWDFHSSENLIAPKLAVTFAAGAQAEQSSETNGSGPPGPEPEDPEEEEEVQISSSGSGQQQTVSFQQGFNGYKGTVDTQLAEAKPSNSYATAGTLKVDSDDPSKTGFDLQVLLRFSDLFGNGAGQIPSGATIVSATLALQTTGKGDGAALHRMLVGWSDTDTWNSMVSGIQPGTEAMASPDLVTGPQTLGVSTFDVTTSVQAWADGALNLGWAFLPQGTDGWKFDSSEGKIAPQLTVTYYVGSGGEPSPNRPPVAQNDTASTSGAAVTINVLANDSDPDGDPLSVSGVSKPANGSAHINPNNTITYLPKSGFAGVDAFEYTVSDGRGGTANATVTVTVAATTISASYIATKLTSNDTRNMEHTNASKSFYHDGSWWAVLPNDKNWFVHKFDGSLPDVGTLGGWSATSSALAGSKMRADIAWDPVNEKLYVLQFRLKSDPVLYKLGYQSATETWKVEASVKVAGSGGVLSGAHWTGNDEIAIGIDQHGNPLLAVMGPSPAGGQQGLHLAYPTSSNLTSWSQINLDPATTAMGGSNGNAKADFVMFGQNGTMKVGLVYSSDAATDAWKIAWHNASPNPGAYGSGWSTQVITTKVAIDDHISVVSDGTTIYAVIKDDKDALWLLKGSPGNWSEPIKVHNGTKDSPKFAASRPTIVLDEDNGQLFIFYQESVSKPRGDIYMKTASTTNTVFDPKDPGIKILTSGTSSPSMMDPQGPVHPVGADTGGYFFLFAKNEAAPEVWYNDILLTTDYLLA